MGLEGNLNSQEDLVAALEGRSDDEINALAAQVGVDKLLTRIFEEMAARFLPDQATGENAVVGWDITSPEGTHSYQLVIDGGTCRAVSGADATPRVGLGFALPDFLKFTVNKLDGMQAFMTGRLRLTGDMLFAQNLQTWFARP